MWNPPNPKTYNDIVWMIVKQIPAGCVSTYGQIASMIPAPDGSDPDQYNRLGARWVGSAMRAVREPDVPWQRVINSQGRISIVSREASAARQAELLRAEGVAVSDDYQIDLKKYLWSGLHWSEVEHLWD